MKTKLLTLLTVVFTTLSFSQTTFTEDGLDYEVISTSPNEVKIIGGTPATTDLVIPANVTDNNITYSVTVIGIQAFGFDEDTRNTAATITSVSIPNTIRVIEDFAFRENQINGALTIPDSVIEIGESVFRGNEITGVTLSENLTELSNGILAFNDITEITIPNGITVIGNDAFHGNALTELVIPEGVTTIGDDAFRLNDLSTVSIPSTVTAIGGAAFDFNAITQFTSLAVVAPNIFTEGLQATFDSDVSNATLNIPDSSLRSYLQGGWSVFGTIIVGGIPFSSAFTVDGIEYLVLGLQPNEVTVIGQEAALTSITIPATTEDAGRTYNVVAVREFAFDGGGLTSITFPNTLREIGNVAFRGNQLTSVVLPDDLNVLGSSAFRDNLINSLTINTNLTKIETTSFQNNQLISLDIPSNITTIEANAFRVNQIESLIIPNSVTQIGSGAFADNDLSSLTLPNGITSIGGFTFGGNSLTNITIPNSVTFIGNSAFRDNQLESLVIPDNVTGLGSSVFQNNNIASLTIGSGLSSLGNSSFDTFANNQLTTLTIPNTLTNLGSGRNFASNPLTTVIVQATTPPTVRTGTNDTFGNRQNIDLTIPDGTEAAYEAATWTGFKSVNGVEQITVGTTFEVAGLNYTVTNLAPNEVEVTGGTTIPTNLVLPETVSFQDETLTLVRVADNAFEGASLTNLTIPNTVRSIGLRAFRINQLQSLVIPNSVTSMGNQTFEANNISSLTLSENLATIGNNVFRDNEITTLLLPTNVTSVGNNTFGQNPLESIESLNSNPPNIQGNSFGNRDNIDLTVPDTTEQAYIDNGWTGFKTINGDITLEVGATFVVDGLSYIITALAPNEVDAIGGLSGPQDLTILSSVTFQDEDFSVTGIGNNAFDGIALTTLVLPNTIKSIGDFTFDNNDLTAITIPEGVETIGERAFRNNDLTDITIPSTMLSIGQSAFGANPLATVSALGTTPASIGTTTFGGSFANIDLTVPDGTEADYEAAGWVGFKSVNGVFNIVVGLNFDVDGLSYRVTALAPNEVEVTGGTAIPANLVLTETVSFQDENFTLVSIGSTAFEDKGITSVAFPETLRTIGGIAFRSNAITEVVIPNSVTLVAQRAFSNNDLVSVTLPEGLQRIDFRSFERNEIESIDIPDTVTEIQGFAFDRNNLTELTLPANVSSIGSEAFNRNDLVTIVSEAMIPPTIQGNSFGNRGNTDLFVPDSEGYMDANWTGFRSITEANKALAIKVFLQGAFINPNVGEENLMRDDLRVANLIPFISPYEDAETILDTIFVEETEGEDAIVDWVFVELRDALDSSIVIEGKSGLLQRDGDVVGVDAVSMLEFTSTPDDYFIAVKHRNHLGVVLEQVKRLSSVATTLDFSKANSPITLGNNSQTDIGTPNGVLALWAGDANADGVVRFSGANAEPTDIRDGVLNNPGNIFNSLFFGAQGYLNEDINMDGELKFSGANSEPLFIRDNILGNPGNVFNSLFSNITSQIPQN